MSETDPARQNTVSSVASTAAVPETGVQLAEVLEERLRAWKHVVGYLEDYVEAAASVQKHMGKEYEKLAKHISEPLKEGHMFDESNAAGIQGLFEKLRTATHAASVGYHEAEKDVKGHVLKELEKLHKEIKEKDKDLFGGALKTSKALEKSKTSTKKALEELGQQTALFDSANGQGRMEAVHDPYLINRGVQSRLHKQVGEENSLKQEMIVVQDNFKRYEQYIVATIQQAIGSLYQHIGAGADKSKAAFGDVVGVARNIQNDFEWNGFVQRYNHILADPATPDRSVGAIKYMGDDHPSVQPLVSGTLQRKGKLFGKYSAHHYVVTPAKYFHEFSDNDDLVNEPAPEMSLYLPDCTIGGLTEAPAAKFTLTGKDALKNKNLTREHEFTFKAGSHEEAKRFYDAILSAVGKKTGGMTPPVVSPQATMADPPTYDNSQKQHGQESGTIVAGAPVTSSPTEEKPAATFPPVPKSAPTIAETNSEKAPEPAPVPSSSATPAQPLTAGDKPTATVDESATIQPTDAPAAAESTPSATPAAAPSTVKDVKFESPAKKEGKSGGGMFGSLKRGLSRKKKDEE